MKRFLNFPNGVNNSNGVYKNYKINADTIACGAYSIAGEDAVQVTSTVQMNLVIKLELQAPADDAKYKAFASAINQALISNPGTQIIDLPGWFLNNIEITNP